MRTNGKHHAAQILRVISTLSTLSNSQSCSSDELYDIGPRLDAMIPATIMLTPKCSISQNGVPFAPHGLTPPEPKMLQ